MMDLRSGLPYHWIVNGLPFQYPMLDHDLQCDVLVVGGGITGALCAHACATAGMDVAVVEARSIATASTSASTALLQYEIDTPLHVLAEKIGEADAARSYLLCASAVGELLALADQVGPCDATSRISLQYASRRGDVEGLRKEHAIRAKHGIETDLLDARAIKARFGFRKPAGLLSQVAAEIDPYRFTHLLLQDVLRMGGRVYDRTPVDRFEKHDPGFDIRTENKAHIRAGHLIMATGYESQRYLDEPGIDLNSTYAVASQRIDQMEIWHRNCLIWETASPYLYLRTTPDGRALIGGLDEPFRNPKRRDALLDRKAKQLSRAFKKLFPTIPFEPEYQWCGTFGSTPDGLPYIDIDPKTGAWFVLGMGGNGITFSQIGAQIVRHAIQGKSHPDAAMFRFGR